MKDKALEALERLWNETKENPITSSMSNRSDRDLIKQALQSNVSEEELEFLHLWASRGVSNELKKRTRIARRVTNPETKNLYKMLLNDLRSDYKKILKYISVFDGKRYPNAMVEIKKPQPTLEELKQSIIDRLNEYYKEVFVFDSSESFKSYSYAVRFYSGTIWFQVFIPLDLAHDITKFFMELKNK